MHRVFVVATALLLTWSLLPSCPVQADAFAASQLEGVVNQARLSQGVGALRIDSRLRTSAQEKVNSMVNSNCYLPRCVNEPTAYERQVAAGYPSTGYVAELINTQDGTATGVIGTWMSEGSSSRFLLLLGIFTDLGCAQQSVGATSLWVCDFGQDATLSTVATPAPTATFTSVPTATPTATNLPATATSVPTGTPTSTVAPPTATQTSIPTASSVPTTVKAKGQGKGR
jgi:hypothetical protein